MLLVHRAVQPILWAFRPCQARFNVIHIQFNVLVKIGSSPGLRHMPCALAIFRPTRPDLRCARLNACNRGYSIDWEEATGGTIFWRHIGMVARSANGSESRPSP